MANAKILAEKEQAVAEVTEKFVKASTCTIVADYRGLNVAQVTSLRKSFVKQGSNFKFSRTRWLDAQRLMLN